MSAPTTVKPATLITGASGGIGAALAHVFAKKGHDLLLVARRENLLAEQADAIAATGRPRPHILALDLTTPGATGRIASELAAIGLEPEYVVNNAGFGMLGDVASLASEKQLAMIDLNVRVLAELSLHFLDALGRRRGGILNVASVAGFFPGPLMCSYYATKAFVLSFSESLHQELSSQGIRVTVLCPGPVPTEFQKIAGIKNILKSDVLACSPEQVAAEAYAGLMKGQRLVVPGIGNKLVTLLPRILPRGFFLRSVAKTQLRQARSSPEKEQL